MEIRVDDPSSPVTSAKLVGFNLNRERYCHHRSSFLLYENNTNMHAQKGERKKLELVYHSLELIVSDA